MDEHFVMENEATARNAVGTVYIAGAGPGNPDLLTVKVLRLLQSAPVIVHDALISEEIQALFPSSARVIDVGKRAGRAASSRQEEINWLLVTLAREGWEVLRLKGGDPLIFGRGGEEAIYLKAHGVPFEIVPGVTAMSGASALGMPLTHRGLSQTCTVLNGFAPYLQSIDWNALVALGGTWVFYMGKGSLKEIARQLLRHGADAELYLGLVKNATLANGVVSVMPLRVAAEFGAPTAGDGPGLIIMGPTVELIEQLSPTLMEIHGEVSALSGFPEVAGQSCVDRWRG